MGLKKGPWTPEEDQILISFIQQYGHGNWRALPKLAGLLRCGKSCRLRWINYLRPDIKRGNFSKEEEETIIKLHQLLGNRWSAIAAKLPGRTDNEIKNFWHTHLKKKLQTSSFSTAATNNNNTHLLMNIDDTKHNYSHGLLSKYAIPMNSSTITTQLGCTNNAMVVAPDLVQSLAVSNADGQLSAISTAKMQPTKGDAMWRASDEEPEILPAMTKYPTDHHKSLLDQNMITENYCSNIGGKKVNEDMDFWYNLLVKLGEPS
ncbi:hypothetical protein TIFTF001_001023 [Ficus carica]|uniref:Uncharacterized protein n=1 Tax=Ficus carica TaxID=3494 RepID=A0AA87Z732_FICCA|nr:hypothetical protein TIFTF001_001023 [Ficus carica]